MEEDQNVPAEVTEDDLASAFDDVGDDFIVEDEPKAEVTEAEESDESDESDAAEPEEAPAGRYKVATKNPDGSTSEQSVSFDELKAGYQRAQESEVVRGQAEQHVAAIQQESLKQLQETRQNYDKEYRSLEMLVSQALDVVSPDNLLNLSQTDQAAYIQAFQRRQTLTEIQQRIKAAQAQSGQVVEQQEMQARMKQAERARGELAKAGISGAQVDSIYEKSKEFGYSLPELGQNLDHRLVVVLKEALAYRALKAKSPQVTEKLRTAPKLPPSKLKTPSKADTQRDRRFATGNASVDDLAAAWSN